MGDLSTGDIRMSSCISDNKKHCLALIYIKCTPFFTVFTDFEGSTVLAIVSHRHNKLTVGSVEGWGRGERVGNKPQMCLVHHNS